MNKPPCQHPGHVIEYGCATERVTVTTDGDATSLNGVGGVIPYGTELILDVCQTCKAAILADDPRRSISFSAAIW